MNDILIKRLIDADGNIRSNCKYNRGTGTEFINNNINAFIHIITGAEINSAYCSAITGDNNITVFDIQRSGS